MSSSDAQRGNAVGISDVELLLRDALTLSLPAWLESRRWFADKGRGIAGVELEDALIEQIDGSWLAVAVVRVRFREGEATRYLVPLAWTRVPGDAGQIGVAPSYPDSGVLIDATETPWFGRWLLARLSDAPHHDRGQWVFSLHPAAASDIENARAMSPTLMRAEQSNSSLRFGDVLMVKLFRRLQPEPNPDEEMLRALAGVGFNRVPPYAGAAFWRSFSGETYPIALFQAFAPNDGDGWSWMLRRLAGVAAGQIDPEHDGFSPERLLGRRTGELHVALCQIAEPGFLPEPAAGAAIAADVRRTLNAVDETIDLLRTGQDKLPESLRTSLPRIIAALRNNAERAEGFREEAASYRIRVHGDFHLGQTLRTRDGDWMLIDFEGEPARPVAERREKTSALKDVAGLLRSFAYARGAAERGAGATASDRDRARLAAWETGARRAFLSGYRAAIETAPVPLVPPGDEDFHRALAAWELDKALYEIAYEIRNRPDWLELPLRTLRLEPPDQLAAATGTVPA